MKHTATKLIMAHILLFGPALAVCVLVGCGDEATGEKGLQTDAGIDEIGPDGGGDCPVATQGCPCDPQGRCEAGLSCTDSQDGTPRCLPEAHCPAGAQGCPCYLDGSCDAEGADGPLACLDGRCEPRGCVKGATGCSCLPDGGCLDPTDVCSHERCEPDTGQTLEPPVAPRCYTPCRSGYTDVDGSWVPCSADGLLEGCIGKAVCSHGSCRVPGEDGSIPDGRACRFDVQCPDFQTCIAGRCYSDCETDFDCRGERRCYRKVCRLPCTAESEACPDTEHCRLVDGEGRSGYCMPLGTRMRPKSALPGQDDDGGLPGSTFAVTPTSAQLTTRNPGATLVVTNLAERPLDFTRSCPSPHSIRVTSTPSRRRWPRPSASSRSQPRPRIGRSPRSGASSRMPRCCAASWAASGTTRRRSSARSAAPSSARTARCTRRSPATLCSTRRPACSATPAV